MKIYTAPQSLLFNSPTSHEIFEIVYVLVLGMHELGFNLEVKLKTFANQIFRVRTQSTVWATLIPKMWFYSIYMPETIVSAWIQNKGWELQINACYMAAHEILKLVVN